MVVVAQLVRALDCGSRGRGFKSPQPPLVKTPGNTSILSAAGRLSCAVLKRDVSTYLTCYGLFWPQSPHRRAHKLLSRQFHAIGAANYRRAPHSRQGSAGIRESPLPLQPREPATAETTSTPSSFQNAHHPSPNTHFQPKPPLRTTMWFEGADPGRRSISPTQAKPTAPPATARSHPAPH